MTHSMHTSQSATPGTSRHTARTAPATPGIVLIVVGVVALAIQLDWIAAEQLWRLWPVALIMAGLSQLLDWWRED